MRVRTAGLMVLSAALLARCASSRQVAPGGHRPAPVSVRTIELRSDLSAPLGSDHSESQAARSQELRVALTFDDLGVSAASASPDISRRIIEALQSAKAPVAVFANCKELDANVLGVWRAFGAAIGNHTDTHLSIEELDSSGLWDQDAWWRDVASCDEKLTTLLGTPVRYFRFPYLRYGSTSDQRAAGQSMLKHFGYVSAHVTVATSEWLLAEYYDAALAKDDQELASELADAYVAHMVDTLAEARRWAQEKVGRGIAQITLLHVNALAADHLGKVLSELRTAGWQFISLAEAVEDPVYSLPDAYTGRCGCSWLARIEPVLKPSDHYYFGEQEEAIENRFFHRVSSAPTE